MEVPGIGPLQRQAARMRVVLGLMLVVGLAVMATGLVWAGMAPGGLGAVLAKGLPVDVAGLSVLQVRGLTLIALVQAALWLLAIRALYGVFAAIAPAEPAPEHAAMLARRAALWMWAALIWSVLAQGPASALATMHNPPGGRAIALSFGTGQGLALLAALLTGFMAEALRLCAALWQDSREIV